MNLTNYITKKIHEHNFTSENLPKKFETISSNDLLIYSNEELQQALDSQIDLIINNYPIYYDKPMMTLFYLYSQLRLEAPEDQIKKYISTILDKERIYPYDCISDSLIYALNWLVTYNMYDENFWLDCIDNENKNLMFLYVCGYFKLKGFDKELYFKAIQNSKFERLVTFLVNVHKILTTEELRNINVKYLPDNLKDKAMFDCANIGFKNIVLN